MSRLLSKEAPELRWAQTLRKYPCLLQGSGTTRASALPLPLPAVSLAPGEPAFGAGVPAPGMCSGNARIHLLMSFCSVFLNSDSAAGAKIHGCDEAGTGRDEPG